MQKLDTLIDKHYHQQSLSEAKLDAILAQAREQQPLQNTPLPVQRRRWLLVAGAATLLLGGGLALKPYLLATPTERVLAEVIANHLLREPLEVNSANYATVRAALPTLDFALRVPAAVKASVELIGGRYCTIRDNPAAQLRLQEKTTDQARTLFVSKLTPELSAIGPLHVVQDGVTVTAWQEHGLFYALAAD